MIALACMVVLMPLAQPIQPPEAGRSELAVTARAPTLEVLRPGSLRRDMIMAQSLTSVADAAEYLTADERIHFKTALEWLGRKHPSTDSPHALDELHSTLGGDRWHLSCATAHACVALLHHMYAAPNQCRGV